MEIKILKMTTTQKKHLKIRMQDVKSADVAYHLAGEFAVKCHKGFWDEVMEVFGLTPDQGPTINWETGEITYREKKP